MKKVIGIVPGSESDLQHVQKVTVELKARGWSYVRGLGLYMPELRGSDKAYTVFPGSVHRDLHVTLDDVLKLSNKLSSNKLPYPGGIANSRLIYLTCIGRNDDASGVIASQTGRRVVAVPPDQKKYEKYPDGVTVYPFSTEVERERDIIRALEWIEEEFENPKWDDDDFETLQMRDVAKAKLLSFRRKVLDGDLQF